MATSRLHTSAEVRSHAPRRHTRPAGLRIVPPLLAPAAGARLFPSSGASPSPLAATAAARHAVRGPAPFPAPRAVLHQPRWRRAQPSARGSRGSVVGNGRSTRHAGLVGIAASATFPPHSPRIPPPMPPDRYASLLRDLRESVHRLHLVGQRTDRDIAQRALYAIEDLLTRVPPIPPPPYDPPASTPANERVISLDPRASAELVVTALSPADLGALRAAPPSIDD